jgi:HlyD family secretion protein
VLLAAGMCAALAACQPATRPGWSGYVEGDYVYLAAPLAGTLTRLTAQAGAAVTAGETLFALDAEAETAARDEAAARLAAAQAQARDSDKGRRSEELAVIEAQLAQAQAQVELAGAEARRQDALAAQDFAARARMDDARSALAQARARTEELRAALAVARLPARADDRAAASAQVQAARQQLRQARWRLAQKQVTAPLAGLVADTYFRAGEWVGAGQPVLALLPPGGIKLRFYVPEAELAHLAPGTTVSVHCDGCGTPIAARISRVATQAEYTPPVIYSNAQRAKLVFLVEARPREDADAVRLRPGLPVDVEGARPADGAPAAPAPGRPASSLPAPGAARAP